MQTTDRSLLKLVEYVHQIPYGRPSVRTIDAMLEEGKGTCSLKHQYLAREMSRHFPDTCPRIVHRVYRVDRERARSLFGERAASVVPEEGLVDVHCYLRAHVGGSVVVLDVTFPGPPWDGRSSMPLMCGDGRDVLSFGEPSTEKRRLESAYCEPALREPFIAALAGLSLTESAPLH